MRVAYFFFFIFISLIIIDSCKNDKEETVPSPQSEYKLNLRWNKAYTAETKEMVETGLLWVFTFLGADIPAGSFNQAKSWNNNIIEIDLGKIGFDNNAMLAFSKLLPQIKQSSEYKLFNSIDIGRFIMLTLNSSNHYYAITGTPVSIYQMRLNRKFDKMQAAIIESTVSKTNRIIELPDSGLKSVLNTVFISSECEGSVVNGTQSVFEYETLELMHNGQFRFGIYDLQGKLIDASDTGKTVSGKPSKCLWCHEIVIQRPFVAQTIVSGYYSPELFKYIVSRNMDFVTGYRSSLKSDIDYNKRQDHTFAELLYISFMEPSAERLSMEWNMNIDLVKDKLKNLQTHLNSEFPYMGTLYDRKDVDPLSPYQIIKVPESARDKSSYEPDMIR